jgi:hypothetical protein
MCVHIDLCIITTQPLTYLIRNYEQLGLDFRLFSAEVLFNKGLSLIYMKRLQEGLADMEEGRREKATPEHDVIDDAIRERAEGYTVFSIVSVIHLFVHFVLLIDVAGGSPLSTL